MVLALKISAVRIFIGPDIMKVNKVDISVMQIICKVPLLLAAGMATMGICIRSTMSVVMQTWVIMHCVRSSSKKNRLLFWVAVDAGGWHWKSLKKRS